MRVSGGGKSRAQPQTHTRGELGGERRKVKALPPPHSTLSFLLLLLKMSGVTPRKRKEGVIKNSQVSSLLLLSPPESILLFPSPISPFPLPPPSPSINHQRRMGEGGEMPPREKGEGGKDPACVSFRPREKRGKHPSSPLLLLLLLL